MEKNDIVEINGLKYKIIEDKRWKHSCDACAFLNDNIGCDEADTLLGGCSIEDEENGWDEGCIPVYFIKI